MHSRKYLIVVAAASLAFWHIALGDSIQKFLDETIAQTCPAYSNNPDTTSDFSIPPTDIEQNYVDERSLLPGLYCKKELDNKLRKNQIQES